MSVCKLQGAIADDGWKTQRRGSALRRKQLETPYADFESQVSAIGTGPDAACPVVFWLYANRLNDLPSRYLLPDRDKHKVSSGGDSLALCT